MKLKVLSVAIGAVALLMAGLTSRTKPDPANVKLGDPEARVVALLGYPQEVVNAPWAIARGVNPHVTEVNAGQCVREFVYSVPQGKGEQTWHVGFDHNGTVISTYGYRPRRAYAANVVERLPSPPAAHMGE